MADLSHINGTAIGSISHFNGKAKASINDIDGLTIPASVISVQWASTTSWDSVPYSGHRAFEITGMESGDVITIYYKVYYWPEATNGTTSGNGKIRENSSAWATECSFSGNTPSSSNENHANIIYTDTVEVQLNCSSGHPDDFVSMGAEILSVTVTAGGKTG